MLKKALSIISLSVLLILSSVMMPFSISAEEIQGFDYENYYQLNYIQSTGNQHIHTQIIPNSSGNSYKIELSTIPVQLSSNSNYLFSMHRTNFDVGVRLNSSNYYSLYNSNTSSATNNTASYSLTEPNTIIFTSSSSGGTLSVNGTSISSSYTPTASLYLYLFRYGTSSNYGQHKLFYCKVYNSSNTLTHYLVPAERKSDGAIGVYDVNTSTFLTNTSGDPLISGGRMVTQYVISTGVNPSGSGSVSGGGTYDSGDTVTLTATASNGYVFDHWSDGSTVNPLTTTATSDMTYTAYFVSDPTPPVNQYVIYTAVSPSGSGTVTGGGTYASGSTIQLTATANNGYEFSEWSDGNTSNPRSVVVSSSTTYTALFVESIQPVTQYTISTGVSPSGSGSVSGGGTYDSGTTVTLTAIPNTGYVFQSWSDGIASNPRSFVLNSNINLTAYFIDQSQIDSTLVGYNIDMIDYEAQQLLYNTGGYIIEGSNGQYQTRVTFNYSSDVSFRRIYQVDCILNNQYIGYASVSGTLIGVQFARTVYVNGNHFTFNVHIDGSVFTSTDVINFDLSHLVKVDTVQNLIENGTPDSNEAASNLEDSNDIASDTFDQIGDIENDFSDNMNDALDDIDMTFSLNNIGSSFQSSAIWVKDQFDYFTTDTPFGSLIGFSLVLGLALLIIGRIL